MKPKTIKLLIFFSSISSLLLSSRNLFLSSEKTATIGLRVSRISGDHALCSEGLQATLTILGDQSSLSSPQLTENDASFEEASTKTYEANARIRLEAYSYGANSDKGNLTIEGRVPSYSQTRPIRFLNVTVPNSSTNCINQENKNNIKILTIEAPIPCLLIDDYFISD